MEWNAVVDQSESSNSERRVIIFFYVTHSLDAKL